MAPQAPTAFDTTLQPGSMVGEYRISGKLGEGGMGVVYAGQHPVIGKRVAVKVLSSACASDPDLVRRFVEEARAVNKIGHPNIIDIFSFGQLPDGRHYFVMEFLDGQSLADRLEKGDIERAELRRLLRQICGALEAAHREGIIHRDLKPENIWIAAPKGEDAYAKLLDFGIAKLVDLDTAKITQTGAAMGSPQFMPPEQCMGRPVDRRADIYAMGVILYRIFTGTLPFQGKSLPELVYQQTTQTPVPPSRHRPVERDIERIILECLQKEPGRRPGTARELGERLERAFSHMKARTPPMGANRPMAAAESIGTTMPRVTDGERETSGVGERLVGSERPISEKVLAWVPRSIGARVLLVGGGVLVVSVGAFVVSRTRNGSDLAPADKRGGALVEKSRESLAAPSAVPSQAPRAAHSSSPSLAPNPAPGLALAPSPAPQVSSLSPNVKVLPPAPKSDVALQIRSVPAGARVVSAADGSVLGKTPIELKRIRGAGSLAIRLDLKGWKPINVDVPLADDFDRSYPLEKIAVLVRPQSVSAPVVAAGHQQAVAAPSVTPARPQVAPDSVAQRPWTDPFADPEPVRKQVVPKPSLRSAPGISPSAPVAPPVPNGPEPPKKKPLRI